MKERDIQTKFFAVMAFARTHGFEAASQFEKTGRIPKMPITPAIPELSWIFAIPNGLFIHGKTDAERARRGKRAKAEGMRPGVADVFLPVPRRGFHGLWIEFKGPTTSVGSEQKKFLEFVEDEGYKAAICRSWQDALKIVQHYIQDTNY